MLHRTVFFGAIGQKKKSRLDHARIRGVVLLWAGRAWVPQFLAMTKVKVRLGPSTFWYKRAQNDIRSLSPFTFKSMTTPLRIDLHVWRAHTTTATSFLQGWLVYFPSFPVVYIKLGGGSGQRSGIFKVKPIYACNLTEFCTNYNFQ